MSGRHMDAAVDQAEALGLSLGARYLLVVIAKYIDGKKDTDECWPSEATLAAKVGKSERQIRRFLNELVTAGVIEVTRGNVKRSNLYRYPIPHADTSVLTPTMDADTSVLTMRTPMSSRADTHVLTMRTPMSADPVTEPVKNLQENRSRVRATPVFERDDRPYPDRLADLMEEQYLGRRVR